jgi:hypothetical protein
VIEHLCYGLLEDHHGGWQDNDGAFSEFAFDVLARTLTLTFNARITDYDTSTQSF